MPKSTIKFVGESGRLEKWEKTPLFCPSCGYQGLVTHRGGVSIEVDDGATVSQYQCPEDGTVVHMGLRDPSGAEHRRARRFADLEMLDRTGGTGAVTLKTRPTRPDKRSDDDSARKPDTARGRG